MWCIYIWLANDSAAKKGVLPYLVWSCLWWMPTKVLSPSSSVSLRRDSCSLPAWWLSCMSFDINREYTLHFRLFQYIQGANLNRSRIAMTRRVHEHCRPPPLFSLLCPAVPAREIPSLPFPFLSPNWTSSLSDGRVTALQWGTSPVLLGTVTLSREAEKLAISLSRSTWANSSTF